MKAILAVAAAVPFFAHADPILFLQYEGSVKSADPAPFWNFQPGDPVKGLVKIYPDLAPPDRHPASWAGVYNSGGFTSDFVVSKFVQGSLISDSVVVEPLPDRSIYSFLDLAEIEPPDVANGLRGFFLEVNGPPGMLSTDSIVQSFDAIPAKDGSSIFASLVRGVGEFRKTVEFALTRVSATPGMCRPQLAGLLSQLLQFK